MGIFWFRQLDIYADRLRLLFSDSVYELCEFMSWPGPAAKTAKRGIVNEHKRNFR